ARSELIARRVGTAIHINRMKRVRPSVVDDVDALQLRHVQDLETVRGSPEPWSWGRLAARIRLVTQKVGVTIIDQRSGPILQRNLVDVNRSIECRAGFVTFRIHRKPAAPSP